MNEGAFGVGRCTVTLFLRCQNFDRWFVSLDGSSFGLAKKMTSVLRLLTSKLEPSVVVFVVGIPPVLQIVNLHVLKSVFFIGHLVVIHMPRARIFLYAAICHSVSLRQEKRPEPKP